MSKRFAGLSPSKGACTVMHVWLVRITTCLVVLLQPVHVGSRASPNRGLGGWPHGGDGESVSGGSVSNLSARISQQQDCIINSNAPFGVQHAVSFGLAPTYH